MQSSYFTSEASGGHHTPALSREDSSKIAKASAAPSPSAASKANAIPKKDAAPNTRPAERPLHRGVHYVPFVIMSLSMIPVPSRLVLCFILAAELNLLILAGTLLKPLKIWQSLAQYKTLLILCALISIVIIYSRLIALWMPAVQMQLGFLMYLQAASSFVISKTFGEESAPSKQTIDSKENDIGYNWDNLMESFRFSIVALAMFAIREVLGYGTITYPVISGIKEVTVMKGEESAFTLIASIHGAFLCTAAMVAVLIFAEHAQDIFLRLESMENKND